MTLPEINVQARLSSAKLVNGLLYGIAMGASLALALWIFDTIMLMQARVANVLLRAIACLLVFMLIGGAAGWISALARRAWASTLIWIAAALAFSWVAVNLPYSFFPQLEINTNPALAPWLQSELDVAMQGRMWGTFAWLFIFSAIVGLMEILMVESATFSAVPAGRLVLAVPAVLMILAGIFVDDFLNKPYRTSFTNINNLITVIEENNGLPEDKATVRKLRLLSTLGDFTDLILTRERALYLGHSDLPSESVNIIIDFEGELVECETILEVPAFCKAVEGQP